MKRLFDKDEVWFAVIWIIAYVVGFGNADAISESIGIPKLITVCLGLVMSALLYGFIRKHGLSDYLGLCPLKGSPASFLCFLPLVLISSVNFWAGISLRCPIWEAALFMISMCFVAFLEEVIFRGLLFKGICRSDPKWAILISSLTFGAGHIVNLLLGAPLLDTLLQLVYASAIGFCYTAIFCTGGSIIPCILSHAVVNATSIFAAESSPEVSVFIALAQTAISTGYGAWLLSRHRDNEMNEKECLL